jgi:hypothetical protein
MVSRLENIIKRFLLENEFEIDGNKFKFTSVEPYDLHSKMAFRFKVDVTLPRENMCYALPKFDKNVQDILINLWSYIGTQFSYSINEILVNGKIPKSEVYITSQKQKEIISRLNNDIGRIELRGREIKVDFNVGFRPNGDYFYELSDVNINFYFIVSASSFQEEGEPINPDLNKIDDLGTAIAEGMNDNDYIRNYVENVIYDVLEPDMKIMNVDDLYYSVSFYVNRIDGIETSSSDWGVYITRELFT